MIWLYWRQVRLAVLVAVLAMSVVAALVTAAFVAGGGKGGGAGGAGELSDSGRSGPRPGRQLGPGQRADADDGLRGARLMAAAAVACQIVPYRGNQLVTWLGRDGTSTYLIQVWHKAGGPALADGDDDDGRSQTGDRPVGPSAAIGSHVVAGVLSLSPWMLALLRANYIIDYAGAGSASGRPALIVTLRRPDGVLAAQYWLDRATDLPLRREMFDSRGRLASEGAYTDLKIGNAGLGVVPAPTSGAWSSSPVVTGLASLRRQGWSVPTALAGNLALVALTTSSTQSGAVVDASYSDGLSVVSVFMQHGELSAALPGWRQTNVSGAAVYSSEPGERSLAWSAQGIVYTVIADAPQETVTGVVAELPHDHNIGFWQRVSRGLHRIASWFNPFG